MLDPITLDESADVYDREDAEDEAIRQGVRSLVTGLPARPGTRR